MKKLKETKEGITLIALVITVIILLILAAININIFLGNYGLFKRTKVAINEYTRTEETEKEELKNLTEEMEEIKNDRLKYTTVKYCIDSEINYEEKVKVGEDCLLIKNFIPEKEGWEFIGWREDTKALEQVLEKKTVEESEIILYAVFKKGITLSYNSNGGTYTPSNQIGYIYYNNGNEEKASFKLSEAITRNQYTFINWKLNSINGTGYKAGSSIELLENTVMYAVWGSNFSVSQNLGNNSGTECVAKTPFTLYLANRTGLEIRGAKELRYSAGSDNYSNIYTVRNYYVQILHSTKGWITVASGTYTSKNGSGWRT